VNYYNEFDPKAAAWLRQLIDAGLIPHGVVDTRSITAIHPNDLIPFTQCHFFAGIGGWSQALKLAKVDPARPLWTGSCPCQPFSVAGKGLGTADERHLWPVFANLIRECRPPTVFGEQVASRAGREWLSGVRADLERMGYAVGAADLCAAGVGAPHIRQRIYWVADASGRGCKKPVNAGINSARSGKAESARSGTSCGVADAERRAAEHRGHDMAGEAGSSQDQAREREWVRDELGAGGDAGRLANSQRNAGEQGWLADQPRESTGEASTGAPVKPRRLRDVGGVDNPQQQGLEGYTGNEHDGDEPGRINEDAPRPVATAGNAWDSFDLLPCLDGKTRRIEPGSFPLAHGVPGRVGLLRGYGNAIVPPLAAVFIEESLALIDN
jgi:DNA (cytosine-5)-methyltransferase 1